MKIISLSIKKFRKTHRRNLWTLQEAWNVNPSVAITICDPYKQKQFFVDAFQSKCSYEFRNIHRKTPVLESLFSKVKDWRPATLLQRDSTQLFSCEYCEFFQNIFLYRTPPLAPSAQIFEHGTAVYQKYSNHILFLPKLIWFGETSVFEVQEVEQTLMLLIKVVFLKHCSYYYNNVFFYLKDWM